MFRRVAVLLVPVAFVVLVGWLVLVAAPTDVSGKGMQTAASPTPTPVSDVVPAPNRPPGSDAGPPAAQQPPAPGNIPGTQSVQASLAPVKEHPPVLSQLISLGAVPANLASVREPPPVPSQLISMASVPANLAPVREPPPVPSQLISLASVPANLAPVREPPPVPSQLISLGPNPDILTGRPQAPAVVNVDRTCEKFGSQKVKDWCNAPHGDVLDCSDFPGGTGEATRFTKTHDPDDINGLDPDDDGRSCSDKG